jgi:hypothetical protein
LSTSQKKKVYCVAYIPLLTLLIVIIAIVPDALPKGVNVTRISATVMVVSWIPLSYSEARGFISHYTVTYSPVVSGRKPQSGVEATRRVEGIDASTTTVEGLDPGTEFSVQVSATNGAGTSGLSTATRVALFQGMQVRSLPIILVL